jgi:hypothetical protein
MKQLQQYQLAYISKQTLGKNPYMNFNSNPTASQQNMTKTFYLKIFAFTACVVDSGD